MGAMTSTPRKRQPRMPIEVRREQVLDAALSLILEHGYAAATMEAIARAANIAKPRVYTAFPERGLLLRALLERERQRVLRALADAMPEFGAAGFDETLVAAAENLLEAIAAQPTSWRLLMHPAEDGPAEVRDHVAASRRYAFQRLRELLEWGRGRREGLADLDLDMAAYSLLAIGEQAVRLVLTDPTAFTPRRVGTFARTLLAALAS